MPTQKKKSLLLISDKNKFYLSEVSSISILC